MSLSETAFNLMTKVNNVLTNRPLVELYSLFPLESCGFMTINQ